MSEAPPLDGIKVIDLTRYLAGPFCTQILGDYGAEIVKVEPVEGARADLGKYSGKDNYFFLSSNRSKKSVQIDTQKSSGPRSPDAPGSSPPTCWSITSAPALSRRWVSATRRYRAQPAHHYLQHLGLRVDRAAARLSGLRSDRAGDVWA